MDDFQQQAENSARMRQTQAQHSNSPAASLL